MSRWARRGQALAAALALTVLAGCGLPAGGDAQPVDPKDVPYGLLAPTPGSAATAATTGTLRAAQPAVYLLSGETTLVPVATPPLPVGLTTQQRLEAVLRILANSPGEAQRGQGLATALPPGVELQLVQLDGTTADVQVGPSVKGPSPERVPLAIGQLVLTATSVPGVDSVQLITDGEPVEVPLPGGALTSEPLHRSDYGELLTPRTPSPTPSSPTGSPTPPATKTTAPPSS